MFKDKLKQLRTERNLTQAEVAKAIGVSSATIGNYEQGTREPRNNEMWQKLANFFGITIDELIDKSYIPPNQKILPLGDDESDSEKDRFKQFRTDIPIIYNGVDITSIVFSKPGTVGYATKEQRYAYIEFNSRSGHVLFARENLLDVLHDIKHSSLENISKNFDNIIQRIDFDIIYWYKKCWNNIDDIFTEATDLESLYDLLDKCLSVDKMAADEFSLESINMDLGWLRRKFH